MRRFLAQRPVWDIAAGGELAIEYGIAPWIAGDPTRAAVHALNDWMTGRGGSDAAETRKAISQVKQFIETHGASRFERIPRTDDRTINNRAGWMRGFEDAQEWLIPGETWKSEICIGIDPAFTAKTMAEKGMLLRSKDGFQTVVKIDGRATRVYILTAKILGDADAG